MNDELEEDKQSFHYLTVKMQNLAHLRIYQSRRFYLDEYPEQVTLRKDYFAKKEFSKVVNNVMENILTKYNAFYYNRWLKRN